MSAATGKFTVVFALYPEVTQLDFTGPHQVLARTPGVETIVASIGGRDIQGDGLTFTGLADLAKIDRCDVICVPGGQGTTDAMLDAVFMTQIRRLGDAARYITSVCTGSLILGAAGFLAGKRAATHWAWRDLLPEFGAVVSEARVERDGNVITGGGVTAGVDFALVLVAELAGADVAEGVQLILEYAPDPPFRSGRPELARPAVLARVQARIEAVSAARRDAVLSVSQRLPST